MSKRKFAYRVLILIVTILLANCDKYYLQKASVLTGRKSPTIITSLNDDRFFDAEFSGSYTGNRIAEYTKGSHTEHVSGDGNFDYECASDTNCNDSLVNNVPYTGDNISLNTNRWNARIQLSITPFYRVADLNKYRLRILAEAQYGQIDGISLFNFKYGSTFSSIGNQIAIHPKILVGYSRVKGEYRGLIRNSSYHTYTWEPDSSSFDSYRYCIEMGATLEIILNKTFSIFSDISGTYQYLFEYPNREYINLGYAEFSPGVKVNTLNNVAFITGVSLPYNPDMTKQLPIQCFAKLHASVGPYLGKK